MRRSARGDLVVATLAIVIFLCGGLAGSAAAAPKSKSNGPLAGGLMSPQKGWRLSPELLVNGSFTKGMTGWDALSSCFSVDRSTRTPHHHPSLMLSDPATCSTYTPNASNGTTMAPGFYTVSGYIKTENISNTSGTGVRMSLWPAGSSSIMSGTSGWIGETLQHVAVGQGVTATMNLQSYGKPTGTAWFGDLSVRHEISPAIQTFMLYPNYRGIMFSDESQVASFDVQLNPPTNVPLQNLSVMMLVRNARGQIVGRTIVTPSAPEFTMSVDLSGLPPGVYRIQGMLKGRGAHLAQSPYEVVKLPASARSGMKAWIDPNNEAHFLDGNAHFVLGIYDTTSYSNAVSPWQPELASIARAPVNMIINYFITDAPISAINAYTQAMAQYGMVLLPTVNNFYQDNTFYPSNLAASLRARTQEQLISKYAAALASNPGVVGYYTQDEPQTTLQTETFQQYQLITKNDPGGFTLAVLNIPAAFSYWRDSVDVLGTDPYPLWGTLGNNLAKVADWTSEAVASVDGARPVWTVIQFFQANNTAAWPTEQQLHDMSWMAITAGAQGLFYWSYGVRALQWVSDWPWTASQQYYLNQLIRDSNGNIERIVKPGVTGANAPNWATALGATTNDGTAVWQVVALNETIQNFLYGELIDVTKGIHELEPVLLASDSPVLSGNSESGTVFTKEKDLDGVRYVFAYNHSANPVTATLSLAGNAGTVTATDEDASGEYDYGSSRQVPISGQSFTDSFAPYQAHVYEIQ